MTPNPAAETDLRAAIRHEVGQARDQGWPVRRLQEQLWALWPQPGGMPTWYLDACCEAVEAVRRARAGQ